MTDTDSGHVVTLANIVAIVDDILKHAPPFPEAYNAARIHCCQAQLCTDQNGNESITVWISDASPTCTQLRSHVYHALQRDYGILADINMEW